jgi:hypothetical protein
MYSNHLEEGLMSQTTKGRVRYIGPFQSVHLPLPTGGWSGEVKHGDVFETNPEHAENLLAQHGNWEDASTTKTQSDVKDGEK